MKLRLSLAMEVRNVSEKILQILNLRKTVMNKSASHMLATRVRVSFTQENECF